VALKHGCHYESLGFIKGENFWSISTCILSCRCLILSWQSSTDLTCRNRT